MSVAKQSFEFVRRFEPWQQDLLLRAAAAPTLSPDDERAALDLLLDDESCGKARRVTPDDFVQAPDAGEPLQLLGIENPTDVNALASGAVLRFDRASLNIRLRRQRRRQDRLLTDPQARRSSAGAGERAA
jgi:hypothetical protein